MAITEVRIHSAIGIASVGNTDSDFFIGPEKRWDRSAPADELRRLVDQLQQALRGHQ